ncbi:MAG: carbohydrate kinase [Nitriliruptor sp.]|nr:MAG: carbohydrate kinase [Nitriliruptor sp.]
MIVVAGEALIDLAPRDGLLLPLAGGSPYNVAVGLGRLGRDTHYLGGLSTDAFGQTMAERLAADDVDLSLAPRFEEPSTLAVVHLDDEGRATYGFYLDGTAAASVDDAHLPGLPSGAALHVSLGAIGFAHEPTGRALAALLRREAGARLTSLDPNVRPLVFEQAGGVAPYAGMVDEVVAGLDLVKVSDEDLEQLHPELDGWHAVARRWADTGPALVVVTRGPDGAVALTADGREVPVPGERVEVVDTVGAGDAFTSGLLGWLDRAGIADRAALAALDDDALRSALAYARRVAAITCTRAGSDPPRADEVEG